MELLTASKITAKYAQAKTIATIFNYKDCSHLLKRFREFADDNPKYFHPYKPYIKNKGISTMYSIICFAHFLENMDLVEAGRGNFKEDLPRLKEVY